MNLSDLDNAKPVTKADILGCWKLIAAHDEFEGKPRINPVVGENATAFLHYLPENRMAMVLAKSGRKPMSGGRRDSRPEEFLESARSFDAYAGTYSFLGPNQIAHHIEVSSYQNDVGTDLVRYVLLEGDVIHLLFLLEHGRPVKKWMSWRRVSGDGAR